MADVSLKVSRGRAIRGSDDVVGDWIRTQIEDLSGKGQFFGGIRQRDAALIDTSLTLNSSLKYWWFQEYGAGQFFTPPTGASPVVRPAGILPASKGSSIVLGGHPEIERDPIKRALEGRGEGLSRAERILARQQYSGKRYAIRPRRGRKRLRYYKDGSWRVPMVAWHPGFRSWQPPETAPGASDSPWGRGLIRVTLWQARRNMEREVAKIMSRASVRDGWTTINLRDEIVAIINTEMIKAVNKLNRYTPMSKTVPLPDRSNMHKAGHLRGSWSFTPAR